MSRVRKERRGRQGLQGNQVSPGDQDQWAPKESRCWGAQAPLECQDRLASLGMADPDLLVLLGHRDHRGNPQDTVQVGPSLVLRDLVDHLDHLVLPVAQQR